MAHVADHLSVSALEQQYRSCTDVIAARHVQTIWLLAKGHTIAAVAATVSFARRWVERLLARYNAQGPQALGDLRRRNGTSPTILKPDLLDKLKDRLREPPPDGGLWTGPKVARWMAGELGLAEILPQRGWEALKAIGWTIQTPRPRHPASATPEEQEAFKKTRMAKLTGRPEVREPPGRRPDHAGSACAGFAPGDPSRGAGVGFSSAPGSPLPTPVPTGHTRAWRSRRSAGPSRAGQHWGRPACGPSRAARDSAGSRTDVRGRCWCAAGRAPRRCGTSRSDSCA